MKVATASRGMASYFQEVFPDLVVLGDGVEIPAELDLLICTGGEDINPEIYGEPVNGAYGINDKRDKDEVEILTKIMALYPNTKLLGVCRGLQLINAFFGGTLYQDLHSESLGHKAIHPIEFTYKKHPLSWMTIVNSLHHQAIKNIGTRYMEIPPKIVAVEPSTGIVEAISWGNRILAVQFHPELFIDEIRDRFFNQVVQWVKGDIKMGDDSVKFRVTSILDGPPTAFGDFTVVQTDNTNTTISYDDDDEDFPDDIDEDDDD